MFTKISSDDLDLLKIVFGFSKSKRKELFIVGGWLRDLLLGKVKQNPDIDFAIKNNSISFAKMLSKEVKGAFVILDEEHGACRIVKTFKNKIYTLDFTDFRSSDLKSDLSLRDFSINSLAIKLQDIFNKDADKFLIDYFNARLDLKQKIVRMTSSTVFDDDPLRIMRAFSFAARFGFTIEKKSLLLAKKERLKLKDVSFERIRDELFKIFNCPNSYETIMLLDKLKILSVIMPEIDLMRHVAQGPYHHLDVLKHSFETLKQLEQAIKSNKIKELGQYLDQVVSSDRTRLQLMKLGAILHDIGKPKAKRRLKNRTLFHGHERIGAYISTDIAKRLMLSNNEIDALKKMVFWHLRPGYLADNKQVTARAKFRYFRDSAGEGISTLLLSVADQRATKGPLTSEESRLQHERIVWGLIKEALKKRKEKKLPRLVDGNIIMKKLRIPPSPLVGKILKTIEESQAIGKIKTTDEAIKLASLFIKKQSGKHLLRIRERKCKKIQV